MSTEQESGKVCLVLLEGIGVSDSDERNAVKEANMEFFESLKTNEETLYYELKASGNAIGLVEGYPGNSGIGVLVIGSGKRQYRNIVRVNEDIKKGEFQNNQVLQKVISEVKEGNNTIHVMGSITDSMEESDISHLYSLLKSFKEAGVQNVYIHGILDGEDAPSGKGLELIRDLEDWILANQYGKIVSITGQNGVLDVNDDITRLGEYYKTITAGANKVDLTVSDYIQVRYDQLEEDSTLAPAMFASECVLRDEDHVFLFNSRVGSCSVLMHTLLLCDPATEKTKEAEELEAKLAFMKEAPKPRLHVSAMVQYDNNVACPVLYPPLPIETTFVKVLGTSGKKQLRVAEESRYTHIKFLLNGAGDDDIVGDDTISIHESAMEKEGMECIVGNMRSTAHLVKTAMKSGYYDQITTILSGPCKKAAVGNYEETVSLCKEMDALLKGLVETAKEAHYTLIMVGTNGDCAAVPKDAKEKSKCLNVPCFIIPGGETRYTRQELEEYTLENVAASCLKVVGVQPAETMKAPLL